MEQFDASQLSAIPYLDAVSLQGRFLSTLCFYDKEWRMWMVAGGRLIETKAWPAESFYFAYTPESPNDILLRFLNFIAQRACIKEVGKAFLGVQDDVFNLAASLAKIELLHGARDKIGHGVHRMVTTEIEYICGVCRSLFDLLQEIVARLWATIQLVDPSVPKKPLKETFSSTLLRGDVLLSSAQLTERFGLPQPLADAYVRHADFFLSLRSFRDNLTHRGSHVQTVFTAENGFLVAGSLRPFAAMQIWRDDERDPNDLVPLLPALGTIIYRTLGACEDFAHILESFILFPPPIAPGMGFFMRGYFNEPLIEALKDAEARAQNSVPNPAAR